MAEKWLARDTYGMRERSRERKNRLRLTESNWKRKVSILRLCKDSQRKGIRKLYYASLSNIFRWTHPHTRNSVWTDEGSLYQRNRRLWGTRAKHCLSLPSTPLPSFSPLICRVLCEAQIKVPDSVCVWQRETWWICVSKKKKMRGCVFPFPAMSSPSVVFVVSPRYCCSSYLTLFLPSFLIHLWKYELPISLFSFILLWNCNLSLFFLPSSYHRYSYTPMSSPLFTHSDTIKN